jgi:signal peptidase II
MKSPYKYVLFTILLISIDQAIKLWMHYDVLVNKGGEIELIPNIFKLHYVTNRGMAFGMELGGDYGKLFLSVFRLFAMVGIGYYLFYLARKNSHAGLLWSIAAVWGGAIGNVIDSTFYGVFLHNSPSEAPSPWFHGQVIDMFYFHCLDGYWPDWLPYLGGTYNSTPIFNFADASIFCGVVAILLFQKKFFIDEKKHHNNKFSQENTQLTDNEGDFQEDINEEIPTIEEEIITENVFPKEDITNKENEEKL